MPPQYRQGYDGLFPDEQLRPSNGRDPLTRTLDQAQTPSPDEAARVFKLRLKTGLPDAVIRRNLEQLEKDTARADFDADAFRTTNPKLAGWLAASPTHAAAARSDIPTLTQIEHTLSFGGAVRRGWDLLEATVGRAVEFAGETTGLGPLAAYGRDVAARNTVDAQIHGRRASFTAIRGPWELAQWLTETVGEQIPLMAPSLAGGAAGAAIGTALTPGLGTTVGGVIRAFVPSLVLGIGETQDTLKELGGADVQAPLAVFVGGTATAALDTALPGKLGSKLVATFGRDTAERVARRALATVVKPTWVRSTRSSSVTCSR